MASSSPYSPGDIPRGLPESTVNEQDVGAGVEAHGATPRRPPRRRRSSASTPSRSSRRSPRRRRAGRQESALAPASARRVRMVSPLCSGRRAFTSRPSGRRRSAVARTARRAASFVRAEDARTVAASPPSGGGGGVAVLRRRPAVVRGVGSRSRACGGARRRAREASASAARRRRRRPRGRHVAGGETGATATRRDSRDPAPRAERGGGAAAGIARRRAGRPRERAVDRARGRRRVRERGIRRRRRSRVGKRGAADVRAPIARARARARKIKSRDETLRAHRRSLSPPRGRLSSDHSGGGGWSISAGTDPPLPRRLLCALALALGSRPRRRSALRHRSAASEHGRGRDIRSSARGATRRPPVVAFYYRVSATRERRVVPPWNHAALPHWDAAVNAATFGSAARTRRRSRRTSAWEPPQRVHAAFYDGRWVLQLDMTKTRKDAQIEAAASVYKRHRLVR